jgi:hypothetical protein
MKIARQAIHVSQLLQRLRSTWRMTDAFSPDQFQGDCVALPSSE